MNRQKLLIIPLIIGMWACKPGANQPPKERTITVYNPLNGTFIVGSSYQYLVSFIADTEVLTGTSNGNISVYPGGAVKITEPSAFLSRLNPFQFQIQQP